MYQSSSRHRPDIQHAAPHTDMSGDAEGIHLRAGDYAAVQIERAGVATLYSRPLARTTLQEFMSLYGSTVPPCNGLLPRHLVALLWV